MNIEELIELLSQPVYVTIRFVYIFIKFNDSVIDFLSKLCPL